MARIVLSCLGLGIATAAAAGAAAGLTGYTSPALLAAASALGGVAGNFATDLCKLLHRPVAARLLEGRSGIAENHRVASALRLAQLAALDVVLDQFDTVWRDDGDATRQNEAAAFSTKARGFVAAETKAAEGRFAPDTGLAADEQALREAVLAELPELIDTSLAARRDAGDAALVGQGLRELRHMVEAAVLGELWLRTATPARARPIAFVSLFEGSGAPDSWFDLFVRDAADRLGRESDFAQIWAAEQTAIIKAIVTANAAVLARIDQRTERIEATQSVQTAMMSDNNAVLRELLAVARAGGSFQRAAAEGISEAAVRAIVERLGGEGVPPEDLVAWLDNWIEAAREQLGRHSNEGEAFEAARREAERRFRAGRLGEASDAFMDELAREERHEADRQAERRHHRIGLLEEAIRFDELAVNPAGVPPKLRKLAAIEGISGPDAIGAWLHEKAGEFYERGRDKGANTALLLAIAIFASALEERTRERVPLAWAGTQNNLGAALQTLGGRESGTARLEEAVAAYRAALEEWTRKRVPLNWAMTQNNLGNALSTLGERESGTAQLKEAVAAYRAALEEMTRERVPLDWATTQNNVGAALQTLGGRESGTARLKEAVAAYRAALMEMTRERVPLDWAATQNNLGAALQTLGERESGTARLEEAVAAHRAALEEMTRERVPLAWAATQNNLGAALQTLGERESGTARLEEAVAAYRAALEEWTRERVPLDWATTQNNLGAALSALGERESGTAQLKEAVAAHRAALEERTRERVPLDWAGTQNNLGNALRTLGRRESGTARLEEAVAAHRAALEERTRERVPLDWAATQSNLGNALSTLGERESGTARLEEAVTAYRAALEERTRERVPLEWAMTQNNLGNTLQTLGERESGTARLEEEVAAWDACLTVAATVWPAEWVQYVRERRDNVRAEIIRRTKV